MGIYKDLPYLFKYTANHVAIYSKLSDGIHLAMS